MHIEFTNKLESSDSYIEHESCSNVHSNAIWKDEYWNECRLNGGSTRHVL